MPMLQGALIISRSNLHWWTDFVRGLGWSEFCTFIFHARNEENRHFPLISSVFSRIFSSRGGNQYFLQRM